jgi:hypothetical protein
MICKNFLPFCGLSLHLMSFEGQKILNLMVSTLSIFSFIAYTFGITSKKPISSS